MTPYKRTRTNANGKTKITWIMPLFVNGKRIKQHSFDRKSDAIKWYERESIKYRENPDLGKQVIYKFEDLYAQFKEKHLDTRHDVTADKYETSIRIHIEPFFRYMKLTDINSQVLFDFRCTLEEKIKAKRIAPKTANDILLLLHLMLKKAVVKYKQISVNPYDCDLFKVPKKPFQWWDDKDYIIRFLNAARVHRFYPAFVTALETGMREAEICGLHKGDIDFARGKIHVYRQWLSKKHRFDVCKHDIERWIDFDPDSSFGKILKKAVESNPDTEILFPTLNNQHIANSKLSDAFQKVLATTDIPRITFHACRHTFASWYMEEIDNINSLMRILGHVSIVTTHKYIHNSSRRKRPSLNLTEPTRELTAAKSLPKNPFSLLTT